MNATARNALVALGILVALVILAWLATVGGVPPPSTTGTPPTLTTLPPVTTSSTPTSSTSTLAPTTTTAGPVVWPAATNCRQAGIGRWEFQVGVPGDPWWMAQYCDTLPYTDPPAMWPHGDREGYRCGYAPLELAGTVVGRVHFVRGADYVGLTDYNMTEGQRWYDGTVANAGRELGDCPDPRHEYQPLRDVTDERPIIAYVHDMLGPIEVRDYRGTGVWNAQGQVVPSRILAAGELRFQLVSVTTEPFTDRGRHPDSQSHTVYSEVVVAAYTQQADGMWWPGFFVYYASLHPTVEVQVRFAERRAA